jgi:hypothetical protein
MIKTRIATDNPTLPMKVATPFNRTCSKKTLNMNQSCHIYSTRVLASSWGKNTQMETKSESAVQSQN